MGEYYVDDVRLRSACGAAAILAQGAKKYSLFFIFAKKKLSCRS